MTTITTAATTSGQILDHTTAFISETLLKPELRYRIFSALRERLPSSDQTTLKSLNLAEEAIENTISTNSAATRISSLRVAEKLLLSYPENACSALLFSLIYSLRRHPVDSALYLLDVFYFDPLVARTEIAPVLFEEIFLVHLLPVFQWFNDQRSRILSSLSQDLGFNATKLLSKVSGGQGAKLKKLESEYEEVLDENCKVFSGYLKEIVKDKDGNQLVSPPQLILTGKSKEETLEFDQEENIKVDEVGLRNGQYNPMWSEEEEKSAEFYNSSSSSTNSKSNFPPFYPQRVSLNFLTNQESTRRLKTSPDCNSSQDCDPDSSSENISTDSSSSESKHKEEEKNRKSALFAPNNSQILKKKCPMKSVRSSCSQDPPMANSDNPPGKSTPKDFVCPITSHLFVDPVTLETGQTYERRAIEEWLERGNLTCPITRQTLQSTQLPKTNYVLKRLIASWQEKHPGSALIQSEYSLPKIPGSTRNQSEPSFNSMKPSTSPTSVISQATIDGTTNELRLAITNLCMSDILGESETAVVRIERFWRETNKMSDIQNSLSKPEVINGFVEILFNSVDPQVLKATVFLLSELGSRDKVVIQTLTQVDSDVDCVVALFKKGLMEAVVLIYLLRPSANTLVKMDMVEPLLMVIKKKEEDMLEMYLRPKTASMLLLRKILGGGEESNISTFSPSLVSAKAIESFIGSLEANSSEERIAAIGILLRCMLEDGACRNIIADKAELAPILESFRGANDDGKFQIVHFLYELVKLNRRIFNQQLLHIIKDEGTFSTMHTFLVYLQTALQDQRPVVAGLLLQLDLLVEPRKMSMYREEAIDALISCLGNSNFTSSQIIAAETILDLQGRFSSSGEPLARAILLKRAGLDRTYKALMRTEKHDNLSAKSEENLEEEKAAEEWERKMASVLVSHEFGLLFEALGEGLKSNYAELSSASFVSATWLTQMLAILPDTGLRGAARVCLLKQFVSILKSANDPEDKALAILALSSFIYDPEGLKDITPHMKDMLKGIRELKKSSSLASEMLKVFSEGQDSSAEFWNHKKLIQVDCSANGEVLSIICFKDKIFSGHSDGTLKVWSGKGSNLQLTQEIREHNKAITSLTILQSGEKLYSGSLDKTTRVWAIGHEAIHCVQVHDMKDQVHKIVVANSISCFIPYGAGVKVHSWSGESKLINPNKYVKCLALVQGKLYCGCADSSLQEIDLASGTMTTIQTGSKKLIRKSYPIFALQVCDGLIYSASSSLDGAAVKIWSTSDFSSVGSLQSTLEVRSMAVSSDLIYLGCKLGTVEIWCKEKHTRVETLTTGTNGKVLCMAINEDAESLVVGTSDGRIQAWGLA
ncbi:hypothetical protein GIB67_025270 [Kingdonia uniflora]|uniref:RING-type E3 ubiquitin transferase n=1 Tax=Kingdonia uniflora TaxID=39325 RepID=A0A7J7NBL5_9MAGN|nr:hypothetical protein GIB67_025270 [Kingdonia uniflora]